MSSALVKSLRHALPAIDVEFVGRNSIRRRYLTLLFSHPLDVVPAHFDSLWYSTTHALITHHRNRITSIEKQLFRGAQSNNASGSRRHGRGASGGPGPVELRKQLSKFRKFLGEERAFWKTVLGRMVRAFGLEQGRPFVAQMGIEIADGGEAVKGGLTDEQRRDKMNLLQKVRRTDASFGHASA